MTKELNIQLLLKAQNGDKDSQDIFLYENKGLVHLVVNKFKGRGVDFDDLVQLGMIGLYKAMMNFDNGIGIKFSTYAVPMISGEIKRFLRDDGIIKVSRSVKELYVKIKYVQSKLETLLSRTPKISEIAEELNISSEDVIYTLNASEPVFSLDEGGDAEDKTIYLKDKIKDKNVESEDEIVDKIALKEMLSHLKQRERQIIIFRFFKEMTQQEVAKILGLSQVQVCRIEKKVLLELKNMCLA